MSLSNRINMRGGGAVSNLKDIIKNGLLNTVYTLTGILTQQSDHVEMVRVSASDTTGYIATVNWDDISTITYDFELTGSGAAIVFKVNGTTILQTPQNSSVVPVRYTGSINVASVTGSYPLKITMGGNNGTAKFYSLIAG